MGLKSWYEDDHHAAAHHLRLRPARPSAERRAAIVPLAEGRVFEMGCGGGLNQPFYDSAKVSDFAGIDPHGKLLDAARKRAHNRGWTDRYPAGLG